MDFIPVANPDIGEKELSYVADAVKSGWVSSAGEYITKFEEKFASFCNANYAISTSNGTAALHLALLALGIKEGDEVLVPNLTFVSSASAVRHARATPILVDIEKETWNINPNEIEKKITPRTKAIMPVHLYGHPCDMDRVMELAKKYNLYVIEDACEAHGAEYKGKKVGPIGDIGCFSFYGNKIMTTGEGGMCVTNNKELADKIMKIKSHGTSGERRYWHEVVGYNYRMTNLQAALGLAQLERINELIEKKKSNAKYYSEKLKDVKGLVLPPEKDWAKNVHWMYSILVENMDRDIFMAKLKDKGIDSRPFFYPINDMPPYKSDEQFPIAKEISQKGINLPSSPTLTTEQIDYITEAIREICQQPTEIKLIHDSFTKEEFNALIDCFKSGYYTQGSVVKEFEEEFAAWSGAKYAVMVNSGSSANLLIITALKEKCNLQDGDEILVPAVTWPTTVYPVIQNNLVPVLCDIGDDFNISLDSMKRMISKKTKALFLVHLLGQPAKMDEITEFCRENNIILVEDCCESLGARYKGKKVGTFGLMGSFSFYFSHHITTVEGGMILTNDFDIYDMLISLRSHGWVRGTARGEKYKAELPNADFVFDSLGYNLRSTNLNAALGLVQLKKLDDIIAKRNANHKFFMKLMAANSSIKLQKVNLEEISSFSLAMIAKTKEERDSLLKNLGKEKIECRPIAGGDLSQQPIFKKIPHKIRADNCINAGTIHNRGLFLPNNQFLDEQKIKYMVDSVNDILNSRTSSL